MSGRLASLAGSAISWQAVQHFGVKAIYLLRLVVLARLLVPDDFGLLAIAVVSIGFLMNLTQFGMIPALVQRAEVEERHYDAAWTVGMLRALAVGLVVALGAPIIAGMFAEPRATPVIRALAIWPLFQAAASIKVADLTRRLQFREVAFLRLSEAVSTTVVSIALATRFGVWALVAGSLAGPAIASTLSYHVARHRPRFVLGMGEVASLARFGRWIFLSSLIAVAGRSVLHMVISRQLGVAELGLYFLAARLAFLPSDAVSEVIGSVAFPIYSRIQSNLEQAVVAFKTQILGVSVVLFPVYGLLLALAPTLTEEVLGPKWVGTAPVIRILAVAGLIGLLGEVAVPVFKGLGQPAKVTLLETVQTSLLIASVWELAGRFGLPGAAAAWVPAILASQFLAVLFLRRIFDRPFAGLPGPLLLIAVVTGIGVSIALAIDHALPGLVGLVLAASAATVVLGVLLLAADQYFNLGLRSALARAFPRAAALLGHRGGDNATA